MIQPKSPTSKELEHKHEIEDKQVEIQIEEQRWKSCCFELHSESSLFFGKLTISFMVIALCSFQLIYLKDCQYQSLYSSILSSVLTYWLSRK